MDMEVVEGATMKSKIGFDTAAGSYDLRFTRLLNLRTDGDENEAVNVRYLNEKIKSDVEVKLPDLIAASESTEKNGYDFSFKGKRLLEVETDAENARADEVVNVAYLQSQLHEHQKKLDHWIKNYEKLVNTHLEGISSFVQSKMRENFIEFSKEAISRYEQYAKHLNGVEKTLHSLKTEIDDRLNKLEDEMEISKWFLQDRTDYLDDRWNQTRNECYEAVDRKMIEHVADTKNQLNAEGFTEAITNLRAELESQIKQVGLKLDQKVSSVDEKPLTR
jgi:hypothetical protein